MLVVLGRWGPCWDESSRLSLGLAIVVLRSLEGSGTYCVYRGTLEAWSVNKRVTSNSEKLMHWEEHTIYNSLERGLQ